MPDHESQLGPAAVYRHDHPQVRSVNVEYERRMSLGDRVADAVAAGVGSWPFIIVQSALLVVWMALNVYLVVMVSTHPGDLKAWDPYPFILLNLVLSFQAAYTGPVVMMSQNRQAVKDRLMAQSDFEVNQKAEEEVQVIMEHLAHQDLLILAATRGVEALQASSPAREAIDKLDRLLERMDANDRRMMSLIARMDATEGG